MDEITFFHLGQVENLLEARAHFSSLQQQGHLLANILEERRRKEAAANCTPSSWADSLQRGKRNAKNRNYSRLRCLFILNAWR